MAIAVDEGGPCCQIIPAAREHIKSILDFLWKVDAFDGQHKEFAANTGAIEFYQREGAQEVVGVRWFCSKLMETE